MVPEMHNGTIIPVSGWPQLPTVIGSRKEESLRGQCMLERNVPSLPWVLILFLLRLWGERASKYHSISVWERQQQGDKQWPSSENIWPGWIDLDHWVQWSLTILLEWGSIRPTATMMKGWSAIILFTIVYQAAKMLTEVILSPSIRLFLEHNG
jgi:hypothetical protein